MMPMTSADLLRRLRRLASKRDWRFETWPGKGSHLHVKLNGSETIVPRHGGDIRIGTLKGILKALGITQKDLEV